MTLTDKYNVKLEVCQYDIDDTARELHAMCNRVFAIQQRGSVSSGASMDDPMLWVEDLASAAAECKELKAKLNHLKDRKAFLCKLLADLDKA
jgi:hypothetical protein